MLIFIVKNGIISEDAFFSILTLNNIQLSNFDRAKLVKACKGKSITGPGNQTNGEDINYKEAIAMLNINMEDLDTDPFEQNWTIRQNQ